MLETKDGNAVLTLDRHQKGKIYRWSGPLNQEFNSIPNHEIFVNAFLQMAFSRTTKEGIAYSLNTSLPISVPAVEDMEGGVRLIKNNIG